MLIDLATLLATLSAILRSRAALELENLALRHQIGVLQRTPRKRPKLMPLDRLLWVGLSGIWSDWRSVLAIVQPETVIAQTALAADSKRFFRKLEGILS
jgi:putative transposase